ATRPGMGPQHDERAFGGGRGAALPPVVEPARHEVRMILLRFHRALATVVFLACAAPASRAAAVADTSAANSTVVESRPSLARTFAPRVSGFTRPDLFQHASLSFAS